MTPPEEALNETILYVHQHTALSTGELCRAQHSVTVRQVVVAALRDPELRREVVSAIKEALANDKPTDDSS